MPKLSLTTLLTRRRATAALGLAAALGSAATLPATASASHSQAAMIQDFSDMYAPAAALQQFRELGASTIRVSVPWAVIAPRAGSTRKPSFNATDPNAYPASRWAPFDAIVRYAQQDGLKVDFTVAGGAPRWAEAAAPPGNPNQPLQYIAWRPNAAAFGQFFRAVAERYDGSFTPRGQSSPLPAVHFWALFNEPNFGLDLGPQAVAGSRVSVAPMMYRGLVNAGWSALHAFRSHRNDTILIGELAARGQAGGPNRNAPQGYPGNYGQTKPLIFIRTLYCLDSNYRQLRGGAARSVGCPTNGAGSRRFRGQNPGLFNASGFGDHPYPGNQSPVADGRNDPDFAAFPDLGNLERVLDRVNRVYGSGRHYSIYNDEYGYITDPPNRTQVRGGGHYVSAATAAYYINWAEYLSWRSPRIATTMQYLLQDPPVDAAGGFTSGIVSSNGRPKVTYAAYRLPLYLPHTSFSRRSNVEVWGDARPAPFMKSDGPQSVSVELNGHTLKTVGVAGSTGYFDVRMKFPRSGSVQLAYTYPKHDPFLAPGVAGKTVFSRVVSIRVH